MNKKYRAMNCPVCDKFYFSELQEGETSDGFYCFMCGWNYDLDQVENHDLKTELNEMSINEYRKWYEDKIKENPNYEFDDQFIPKPVLHKCPICNKYEFEDDASFDICPYCGWEDDGLQNDEPDYSGGANELSQNEYREQYNKIIKENPDYTWFEEK